MRWIVNSAVVAGLFFAAPAEAESVESLAWLSGHWTSEADGRWTEEQWTAPRGGMMLGVNRSGEGDRPTGFEFMRIAADAEGAVSFWGSPGGKPAVPFRLTDSSPNRALFENPAHDYPTRLEYRREGDALVATVSGSDGANALTWRFRRVE